jgi:hypothetical protein
MTDELDYLVLDDEAVYEVWAVGYDLTDQPTGTDYLLCSFADPDEAVTFADEITVTEIRKVAGVLPGSPACFSIEVETVVNVDGEQMNTGTVYRRYIYYNSIAADVSLASGDYEIQDDGSIKVSKYFLESLKDRDTIKVLFADEKEHPILTFKIIDEFDDANYLCDIVF